MHIVEYGSKIDFKINRRGFTSGDEAVGFAKAWVEKDPMNWADVAELRLDVDEDLNSAKIDVEVLYGDGLVSRIITRLIEFEGEGVDKFIPGPAFVAPVDESEGQYLLAVLVDVKDATHDEATAVLQAMEAIGNGPDRTGDDARVIGGTWYHVPSSDIDKEEVAENSGVLVTFEYGTCHNCGREDQVVIIPWSESSFCFRCGNL